MSLKCSIESLSSPVIRTESFGKTTVVTVLRLDLSGYSEDWLFFEGKGARS